MTSRRTRTAASMTGAVALVTAFCTAAITGCDLSTAPRWDTTWIVPAASFELPLDSILPYDLPAAPVDADAEITLETPAVLFRLEAGESTVRRVRSGSLLLELTNPFPIGGRVDLRFEPPDGTTFSRSVDLESGTTDRRLEFTGPELQTFLRGDPIAVRLLATLSVADSTFHPPAQARLSVRSRIEFVLRAAP